MPTSPLSDLDARGLLHETTDRAALDQLLSSETVPFYIGYDPSAPSLHLGNLVPITLMARLQAAGHKPLVLVGGATGMIGDPSGKSSERILLDEDALAANADAIRQQLSRFLDFGSGATGAVMVNNADWFAPITFIEFLRDVGKYMTVNYMTAKESIRARLEDRDQGISYTEFSYMLLQAYDFVHLAEHYGCRLQAGASDQWGNITAGIELQRKLGRPPLHGLVCPLLLDSQGAKMGKTAGGDTVWLSSQRTSPYAMYQYLLNVADVDVEKLLETFSRRPLEEIDELVRAHGGAPERRAAQRALAEEVCSWVHGEEATRRAVAASRVMFGGSLDDLDDADLEPLLHDVPSSTLERSALESGVGLVDLLVKTELAASKSAARRLLGSGGVYLNNVRVGDGERTLSSADLGTESMMVLRAGKKSYHIVKVVS